VLGIMQRFCDNVGLHAGVAQLVERNLAKVEVESSRLFSRSRIQKGSILRFPFLMQLRRGSKEVMQRPAKPSRAVRFRFPPPKQENSPLMWAIFFAPSKSG
jgi:hypothetical protein